MSDTVIILQDECILAAEGKAGKSPKIQKVERIPIDVFGDPFEQWKEALDKYKKKHNPSQVRLVLPTSYSSARVTQIPYARGRQLTRLAENVMAENGSDWVQDYAVIKADRKKGICLCCGGAEEDVLKKIRELTKEVGISVQWISVPMECYLNTLGQLKSYQNDTEIVLLFEEGSVTSILFREGQYLYSTRSRIFSERGTLDFGTEIVRNISGILQFYSTTKSDVPITKVFYAGCSTDDFEVSEDGIHAMNLEVEPLDAEFDFAPPENVDDWLICIGAMISTRQKEINLNKVWKGEGTAGVTKKESLAKHLMFPAITFGICLVALIAVMVWNYAESHKIEKMEDWINDPQIQSEYQEANAVREESDRLDSIQNQVEQTKSNLATYPDLDAEMIAKIVDVGGSAMTVQIKTMDSETGELTFNAVSSAVIDIPAYVRKLSETGLFSTVNYSGYSYNDGEYSLMLSCVLKGAETGGEDQ